MFTNAQYSNLFRRNYLFTKYQDYSEYYIELEYTILRDSYASRLATGTCLLDLDIKGSDGLKIFANISDDELELLEARNYRLLDEQVSVMTSSEDYYKVTETYGYAPSKTFEMQDTQIVSFWGTKIVYIDDNPRELLDYDNITENSSKTRITGLESVGKLGDIVSFVRDAGVSSGLSWSEMTSGYYECTSDGEIDGEVSLSTSSGATTSTLKNSWYTWNSERISSNYIQLEERYYPGRSKTSNIDILIEFFLERPSIFEKTTIENAIGVMVEYASEGTVKNLYSDGRYVVQDSEVKFDNTYHMWRREIRLTDWKVYGDNYTVEEA